jgi:hypothetical protein
MPSRVGDSILDVHSLPSFQSAYLAWLALIWDALQRVEQSTEISDGLRARAECEWQLEVLRLELIVLRRGAQRVFDTGAISAECLERVLALSTTLERELPGDMSSRSRVAHTLRVAQDSVFAEVLNVGRTDNVLMRHAS